jgi:ribosomal protein S18 acetylase RimI-like enzyme
MWPMTLIVRRLKVMDIPSLEQIQSENLKRFPGRSGWLDSYRLLLERSLDEEPEGVLIGDQDGRVVGSAIVRQRGKHPMNGRPYGHIYHLSALLESPDAVNVTMRLLREAEAYLRSRGCESVHLSLPADDPAGAELFRKSGYEIAAWELRRTFK